MDENQEDAKKKTKTTCNSPYDNEIAVRRGVAWITRCDPEKEIICGLCKEGESLNRQIHEMEEALTTLKAIRASNNTKINTSHDPLTRLPIELASDIFMHLRPLPMEVTYRRGEGADSDDIARTFKMPLLLGAVCRAWRAFAWSMPRLWSTLSINVCNGNDEVPDIIRQWLGRSGQLPLSIYLYAAPMEFDGGMISADPHGDEPFVKTLMEVINGCSGRWFYLNLDIPKCLILRVHCSGSEAPMLETLTLQMPIDDEAHGYLNTHENERIKIGPTPNLRRIHCSPTVMFDDIDMDWASVLRAEFLYLPLDLCCDLLREATNLTHLTLRQIVVDEELPTSVIRHPNLVFFRVIRFDAEHYGPDPLLPYLDLPVLEDLEIFANSESQWRSLASFLQRSCAALRTLRLSIYESYMEQQRELITVLDRMPCLETLHIMFPSPDSPLASQLPTPFMIQELESINESLFLPKLETVRITVYCLRESYHLELLLRPDGLNMASPRRSKYSHSVPSDIVRIKPSYAYYLFDIATQRALQPTINSNFQIKSCAADLNPFIDFLQQALTHYVYNAGVERLSD